MIRAVTLSDSASIGFIYNHYIEHTTVTFEEASVTTSDITKRINKVSEYNLPWLVAVDASGNLLGYAYATKWRERYAYRFSVEVSVYLSHEQTSRGIGKALYHALFKELKRKKIHSAIAGITLPNERSIHLHEKFNMVKVAHFTEVGFKFGRWLDVGYWQVTL